MKSIIFLLLNLLIAQLSTWIVIQANILTPKCVMYLTLGSFSLNSVRAII